jgi:hypothetical protein
MGNPTTDPYADLIKRYNARRQDYLHRLTSDEATFAQDPERFGVAKRRGYLKGHGPRPECPLAEQDAAALASNNHLIVWTDSPCLRAGIPEPWDSEGINDVIARLATIADPEAFEKSIPIPEEPPDEEERSLGFRPLMRLLRQLTLCGRGDFRMRIRTLLFNARDMQTLAPDFNLIVPFDSAVIESVVESLDGPTEPDPTDIAKRDELIRELTTLTIEGEAAPIDAGCAQKLLKGIYALLPSAIAIDLIRAAIDKGRPGPYVVRSALGARESPGSFGARESPGSFGARESPGSFGGRESPGSFGARESPTGGFDSPNPRPPDPRGANTLLLGVWNALHILSWLGEVGTDESYTVRSAVLIMAVWLRTGTLTLRFARTESCAARAMEDWLRTSAIVEGEPVDKGAESLIQELFQDHAWVPPHTDRPNYPDFVWPPYTREGIYWWRTIIKSQCIEHCFALKDTADFKSTDLIRFLNLFPAPDKRIPDYVRTAVALALLWFKYWWDEPPAKDGGGADIAEMTMWSENHQILFGQSQLLAGVLFRNFEFARSGTVESGAARTGQDHIDEGLTRVERWLDLRLKFGFSEWNAPGYYDEDFPPLFNLVDFCNPSDPAIKNQNEGLALARIKVKAAMVLDLLIFDCARFTCRGSFGATAGRAYWEKKAYGWEQSIGNTIEILFGTRGDYTDSEGSAVALATSTYDVPEALLGIGLDRVVLDQTQPFVDRTRVSIDFDNAAEFNIGFDSEEDVLFWWGLQAYYTDRTLEATKRVIEAHDNLSLCEPFEPLRSISKNWLVEALVNLISLTLDYLKVRLGVALVAALPFPLNLVAAGIEGKSIVEGVVDFFKDLWEYLSTITKSGPWKGLAEGAAVGAVVFGAPGAIVGGVVGFFGGLFGGGDKSSQPHIPDTVLQHLLEKLLVAFTQGTVLSTANIVTYNNGDAMLSSVQNHLPGLTAFQKQPWMANLGCDACVWTTARFMAPDLGSYVSAWGRFFKDLGLLRLHEAAADVLETPALQFVVSGSDLFGNNGPNYWTGSLALPMIVQHENAAIIAYNIPELQRSFSGFSTHAWFPKQMFDETRKHDSNGGTWFFGRKDHLQEGVKVGSGYVALFSAIEADWTNEMGNSWNDREIMTKSSVRNYLAGSNIWISVVGNEHQFADVAGGKEFDTFCEEIQNAYLHVSGVGSIYDLECSFDIPRASAPGGRSPRLELFYGGDSKTGRFAGDDIPLDNFPRFENRYVTQMIATGPTGSGLRPQVEGFSTSKSVGFGSSSYRITHPATGLTLDHDTSTPTRRYISQRDQAQQNAPSRRLQNDSLSTIRRSRSEPARQHPLTHPHLDRSIIRRRTP